MSGVSLNGIASGLDTNKILEELMKIERRPYEALEKKHSTLEEKKNVIRQINTKLSALRLAAADLMYSSSFNLTSAKVADSSVIRVTSTDAAVVNSYDIYVEQLAKKHVVASGEFAAGGNALTGLVGEKIRISGKGDTTAKEIELKGSTDEEILNNLMKDINSADVGVRASIMETSPGKKSLILTSTQFGEDYGMTIGTNSDSEDKRTFIDASNAVLTGLGLAIDNSGTLELNAKQAAQNAKVTVNGIEITHADNTLDGVIEGVTIELLKEDASTTFDIAKDYELIADKVQKFVDAYNEVIELIRTNTARGALLQGDSTLRALQDELQGMLNAEVAENTNYKYLVSVGLEVDKGVTSGSDMTGKINFDRKKFIEALTANPDEVYRLFAHDDTTPANKDGIAMLFNQKLYEWTKFGTGLLAYKVDGFDSEIKNVEDQMESMQRRLELREQQLLKQFSNMEVMLSSLQNEMSWLNSQLSSLMR